MSLAITHFAVGGILSTIVLLYLLPPTRYARSLVLLGGVWGMIPDLHQISPVFTAQLRAYHHSPFANIFWLHETLDVIDPGDSTILATLALGAFIVTALFGDWWSYTAREHAATTSESVVGTLRSVVVLGRIAGGAGIATGSIYLALAVFHPGVREFLVLYLGIGTILLVSGLFGLTAEITVSPLSRLLPNAFLLVVRVVLGIGAVAAGTGLLVAPLRFGISSLSVVYAGLGSTLLLHVLLLARVWVDADTANGSIETASSD